MAVSKREIRRIAGVLNARLPETRLDRIADPRNEKGRRWRLNTLLSAVMLGLMTRRQNLAETESLTEEMSVGMRRMLHIPRRVPDTTMRDALVEMEPTEVRGSIHAQMRAAHRRKALAPGGLPFGVVAMDGKVTAVDNADGYYAQDQGDYGLVRTVTCSLVSSRGKPCIDAIPIPASTNEMGHFELALAVLVAAYTPLSLFKMVSYDSGACSLANADAVVAHRLLYLFALKDNQPTLFDEARRLLGHLKPEHAVAETVDVVGKHTVTRRIYVTEEMASYMGWKHLRTTMRVESEKAEIDGGAVVEHENRYFISNLSREHLSDEQWLLVIRLHWGVENNCHNTWDVAFEEDDHPWIKADPKGMVVVLLLRRLAFNILTLFRSVTLRSEERRDIPWKDLMRWFYNAVIAATEEQLENLRARRVVDAFIA